MTTSFDTLRQVFSMAQLFPQKIAIVLDDQMWTYSELVEQVERVICHLKRLKIAQGQIIYQFVERGFEMACGLLGIMCAGGVYCALNPTEPSERLVSIIKQIKGQYVIVHKATRNQFPGGTTVKHVILMEEVLSPLSDSQYIDDRPAYKECGAAFIVCTSGTTGRPKAVVHTHRSYSASIIAHVQWDVGLYTIQDQALQVASSSWILHLMEISLPLVVGGTLVLLRPSGYLDMGYFSQTLSRQKITTLIIGPGIIRALTSYLEMSQRLETLDVVCNLCVAGD